MTSKQKCPVCGSDIPPRNTTYCSQECWKQSVTDRVLTKCECCGKTYEIKRSKADRTRFCSKECQTAAQRNKVHVTCEYCEEDYEIRASRKDSTRFCSRSCKDQWKRSKEPKTTACTCSYCGMSIEKEPYLANQHDDHFCDDSCRGRWISENQKNSDNPNWKGGVTHEFGENWPRQRRRVMNRDEICQICGSDGSDTHLDVHHIVPRSEFDIVENANSLLNLVLLCRSCHKQAEHGSISCSHPEILFEDITYVDPKFAPHNQILPIKTLRTLPDQYKIFEKWARADLNRWLRPCKGRVITN